MPVPTHKGNQPGQQPNSNKGSHRPSQNNKKLPPQRSRGAPDDNEIPAEVVGKFAIGVHLFSERLAAAAAWSRAELPPRGLPFSLSLWLLALVCIAAIY